MTRSPHRATPEPEERAETTTKKPVCYRCRKGIPRGQTALSVAVWSVANRRERVTVCGACLIPAPPTPSSAPVVPPRN